MYEGLKEAKTLRSDPEVNAYLILGWKLLALSPANVPGANPFFFMGWFGAEKAGHPPSSEQTFTPGDFGHG